jgi:nucleotide-binding universal stress UspA family protein
MKKFIAAFDGLDFSESTMSYSIFLAKHSDAHLIGVFLDDFMRRSYGVAELVAYEGTDLDKHVQTLDEKDKEERAGNVEIFEKACQVAGINYSIHKDKNVALQELLHESVYADLLIISENETLTRYEESVPTRFIRNLLNEVQCPVVIAPPKYHPINKIILLYDGEPSSVHAVRTFSYLFDPLKAFDTEIITVKDMDESLHLPNGKLIKEFIKRHYPKADHVVLKGHAEDEILKYLRSEKKHALIVLGAYRRTRFSRMFRPSMADYLLQYLQVPLFIAHNKS